MIGGCVSLPPTRAIDRCRFIIRLANRASMNPLIFHELVSGRKRGPLAGITRAGLRVMSWGYRAGAQWRNRGFDRGTREITDVSVPVISIGNLTAGGTGKTPMVEWVCRWLRQRHRRVAILSRGYGAERDSVNDEALQLEHLLPDVPHLQDPDRVKMASVAIEELESEVLVLDDGFQHRRLGRDLDVVLIDATNPFGYGHVLPRGLLREPISSLRRASLIVLTRVDQVSSEDVRSIRETIRSVADEIPIVESSHQATHLRDHQGAREALTNDESSASNTVAAFCGIGNPASFRLTLEQSGYEVADFRAFPDHHRFDRDDVDSLSRWVDQLDSIDQLICTHKDLVKIGVARIGGVRLRALCVELDVREGRANLEKALATIDAKIQANSESNDPIETTSNEEIGS